MKHPLTGKRHALPLALLSAVLAVPVVIAGCGGGSSSPGTTTAGTTTAGTTTAGTTTAGTTTAGTTTAGTTTAGTTTAGTTTAGGTTAGGTTAGTTTAGTTAGGTTAGGTTSSGACANEPANLMFTNFNGYNGSKVNTTCGSGFSARPFANTIGSVNSLFEDIGPTGVAERRFSVIVDSPTPPSNGTRYNLASIPSGSQVDVQYLERANGSNTFKVWTATAGTLTFQNVNGPIVVNLSGGAFSPTSGGAAGSFTLNGTVNFNKQF